LRAMAVAAGWQQFEVHRHFPYRIALVEKKLEPGA